MLVAMVMLWGYLGPASLAGLGIIILLIGINMYLAAQVKKLQVKITFLSIYLFRKKAI